MSKLRLNMMMALDLGDATPALEQVEAIAAPGVTHLRYRIA